MNCVFCAALTTETDRIIYRDEHVFVILNIEPVKEGHLMILPIRHAEQLQDLTATEAQAFLKTTDQCLQVIANSYEDAPVCIVNGWKHRSQPHLHAHVIPSKTGLRGLFKNSEGLSDERVRLASDQLKPVADKLRSHFEKQFQPQS